MIGQKDKGSTDWKVKASTPQKTPLPGNGCKRTIYTTRWEAASQKMIKTSEWLLASRQSRHEGKSGAARPRALVIAVAAAVTWVFLPHASLAHDRATSTEEQTFTDNFVKRALQLALINLPKTMCAPNQACDPATQEELANPPLTLDQARDFLLVGRSSGIAEWCGLAWQGQLYLPLMQYLHHVQQLESRVLAIVSLLHGQAQGAAIGSLAGQECTRNMRDEFAQMLAAHAEQYKSLVPEPR